LVIHRDDRDGYLTALEQADTGNLIHLVNLFVKIQERMFTRALSAVMPPAETLLDAAAEVLRDPYGVSERDKAAIGNLGYVIASAVNQRLTQLSRHPAVHISAIRPDADGFRKAMDGALPTHISPLNVWRWETSIRFPSPSLAELTITVHPA